MICQLVFPSIRKNATEIESGPDASQMLVIATGLVLGSDKSLAIERPIRTKWVDIDDGTLALGCFNMSAHDECLKSEIADGSDKARFLSISFHNLTSSLDLVIGGL